MLADLLNLQRAFDHAYSIDQVIGVDQLDIRQPGFQDFVVADRENIASTGHADAAGRHTFLLHHFDQARRLEDIAAHVGDPAPGGNAFGHGVTGKDHERLILARNTEQTVMTPHVKVGEVAQVASPGPPVPLAGDDQCIQTGRFHCHARPGQSLVTLCKICLNRHSRAPQRPLSC